MFLTAAGCANVILTKANNPDLDIIMLTLLMQRVIGLGGSLIGVLYSINHVEDEALEIQKMFRVLNID